MQSARIATADDLPRLAQLLDAAVAATPSERGGHLFGLPWRHHPARQRLTEGLARHDSHVVAGVIDDYVVGFALAHLIDDVTVVEELYVEPKAREVGVGESLVDAVVAWAHETNSTGVDMAAFPGDRATKNLGERSGFKARAIWMHRPLR